MGGYLRIRGALDRERFEQAIEILIARNDGLRIVLREGGDVPVQEIVPQLSQALDYFDFSSRQDPLGELQEWMDRPFQLLDHPLFYFALVRLREDEYCWFHVYHHLIVDAYAHSLLVQQLAEIYTGLSRRTWDGTDPVFSITDHFRSDAEYIGSAKRTVDAAYWRERFKTLPEPVIERKAFGSHIRTRRTALKLPRVLYDRMRVFAASNGASTFHLILAALYIRFARATGREDFLIGLPTLNRGSAAFKRTVGLFTGVTPAWLRLGTDLGSLDLIQAVGRELRKDYRHQRFPLHEINRCAELHKEGRVQIYDIILSYQNHSYDVLFDGLPSSR